MPGKKKKSKAAAPAAKRPEGGSALPAKEVHTLDSLEQVKILSDSLRIRILESLMVERTTKQVAELLGERPTKLYHHVDALERVGLIRPTRTRQNRGTVEKYYQSVARSFRADPRLFEAPSRKKSAKTVSKMLTSIFDNTSQELRSLLECEASPSAVQEEGVLSYVEIRARESTMRALRTKLTTLIKDSYNPDKEPSEGLRRYRLTVAFFPLDKISKKEKT